MKAKTNNSNKPLIIFIAVAVLAAGSIVGWKKMDFGSSEDNQAKAEMVWKVYEEEVNSNRVEGDSTDVWLKKSKRYFDHYMAEKNEPEEAMKLTKDALHKGWAIFKNFYEFKEIAGETEVVLMEGTPSFELGQRAGDLAAIYFDRNVGKMSIEEAEEKAVEDARIEVFLKK